MCNIGKLSIRMGSCHDFEQAKIHIDPPNRSSFGRRKGLPWCDTSTLMSLKRCVFFVEIVVSIWHMIYLYVLFWFGHVVITCTLIQLAVIYHTIYQVQVMSDMLLCPPFTWSKDSPSTQVEKLRWLVNQWPMFMAYQWLPPGMFEIVPSINSDLQNQKVHHQVNNAWVIKSH